MYLLEDFVDVNREGLDSSSSGFSIGRFSSGSWFFSHFNINLNINLENRD